MNNNYSTEYAERSNEELLQLASDRASLTGEAAAALDAELGRRNLTKSDQLKHERFVEQSERRESRRRRRRILGNRRDRAHWVDNFVVLFWSVVVMALIALAYQALPNRYYFAPDWQEASVDVMFATVFIAVGSNFWWRKMWFWLSLLISSTVQLLLVHAWIRQNGTLIGPGRHGYGKAAVFLGIVLFFVVFGGGYLLRKTIYGEETVTE